MVDLACLGNDLLNAPEHRSVMVDRVVHHLLGPLDGVYVDGTAGLGGHSLAIVRRLSPKGRLIVVDRDGQSLELARQRLEKHHRQITFCRDNFKNLPLILSRLEVPAIDGLLLALGISSFQLLSQGRGFSFQADGPLDMRMDQSQKLTAAELVNSLEEVELARILYTCGEERRSRALARKIVEARQTHRITTTAELADIVGSVLGPRRKNAIHPATRTFMALRIYLNKELEGLTELIEQMTATLSPGGRMVVITFHSLEDRLVKHAFQKLAGRCVCHRPPAYCTCPRQPVARLLTRKPEVPDPEEIRINPRARSAKLRSIEKC